MQALICPMTTGILLKIVAFAAEENREGKDVTPYWRVIKDGGKLNDRISDGITLHADLLNLKDILSSKAKTEQKTFLKR